MPSTDGETEMVETGKRRAAWKEGLREKVEPRSKRNDARTLVDRGSGRRMTDDWGGGAMEAGMQLTRGKDVTSVPEDA